MTDLSKHAKEMSVVPTELIEQILVKYTRSILEEMAELHKQCELRDEVIRYMHYGFGDDINKQELRQNYAVVKKIIDDE